MGEKADPRWGYRSSGSAPLACFDDEKFDVLGYVLQNELSTENRCSINFSVMKFIEHREVLDNPFRLNESKAACPSIINSAPALIHALHCLDRITEDRLCDITPSNNQAVRRFFAESDLTGKEQEKEGKGDRFI